MKKIKVLKLLAIVLIAMYCLFSIVNPVFAEDTEKIATGTGHDWSTDITNVDKLSGDTDLNKSANTIIGAILNVMRIVGTGIAFIMIIIVAIKYMSAAPGDRADIKKHAVPFVVGAIVLFASTGILTIIQKFATNIGG